MTLFARACASVSLGVGLSLTVALAAASVLAIRVKEFTTLFAQVRVLVLGVLVL